MAMILFSYQIIPSGGASGQTLVTGHLYTTSVEAAKKYVEKVRAPNVAGRTGLEVILLDSLGSEIWRGPYVPEPQ